MRLIDDAGAVWHKFWSVRLSLLSGLVCAADAGYEVYCTGQPPYRALIAGALSFGAAVSRVVAQPKAKAAVDG